jgi:hypothetical protein
VSGLSHEFVVPGNLLADDAVERDLQLQAYFDERVASSARDQHGDWHVTIEVPPTADYYIDPRLDEGLTWWNAATAIADVPYSYRREEGIFVGLSDAWTLLSWSEWLADVGQCPDRVTIIHLDDHDDLMTPRLALDGDSFVDLITEAPVILADPASVRNAIRSGAIGMGSFLAPFVHSAPFVDIRHLCDTGYAKRRAGHHLLVRNAQPDTLLRPAAARPAVSLLPASSGPGVDQLAGCYRASDDAEFLFSDIPDGPILLHIDLDFFNNRFNGNSDWTENPHRHDPTAVAVRDRVEQVVTSLAPVRHQVVDVSIGISPAFCPAEFWQPVCDTLISELATLGAASENRKL